MLDDDIFETGEHEQLEELSEAVLDEQVEKARSELPVLDDMLDLLAERVSERECVGLILVDTSKLERWERRHGAKSFTTLMGRLGDAARHSRGESIRSNDIVCLNRHCGDTLLIFMTEPRDGDGEISLRVDFDDVIARFERRLFEPFASADMSLQTALDSVSIGSALLLHNSSVDPHREIYRAIRRARADAEVKLHEMQRRRHRVVGHMIAHRKIESRYQPIVDLNTNEIRGFEALSRACDGDADELGVHLFVAASRAELEGELDQVCRSLSIDRRPEMKETRRLFVNCLPPTFFEPNRELDQLIDKWLGDGLAPDQLVFEVTEKITHEQAVRIMPTIERLRERGFLFALDDVGTGTANLRLLADLEPEYIKMDTTLTRGIEDSNRKQALAGYLLDLASKSDAKLIAEGIEKQEELDTLLKLGVELGQGFYLGRPNPAEHWLQKEVVTAS